MKNEKHPAEIALALLRDFPEIDEARMAAEGTNRPQDFRKFARPIINAYFAPLGEKVCRAPVETRAVPRALGCNEIVIAFKNIFKAATGADLDIKLVDDGDRFALVWLVPDDDLVGDCAGVERLTLAAG